MNFIMIALIVLTTVTLVMFGIAVVLLRYPRQVDKVYDACCNCLTKDNK